MNIGKAAQLSGLSSKMIRHYESLGLIKPKGRSASGYRMFSELDLTQLKFIRHSRTLGFSLEQVGQLLKLWQQKERASIKVKVLAEQHLKGLNAKIESMLQMKQALEALIETCPASEDPNCPILISLSTTTNINTDIE